MWRGCDSNCIGKSVLIPEENHLEDQLKAKSEFTSPSSPHAPKTEEKKSIERLSHRTENNWSRDGKIFDKELKN